MGNRKKSLNIDTGAIILAAGLGQRLASVGPKPFLLYGKKSFLEIAVENAQAIKLNPVVIITNESCYQKVVDSNFPVNVLINYHPEQGMLSSILIGLKAIEACCSGFFLCPIDYPLVQQTTYIKLLVAHQSNPDQIIKPNFKQQSGHPIVIPQKFFQTLKETPLDRGVGFMIHQFAHLTKAVEVTDPGIVININTPELYYQYCK